MKAFSFPQFIFGYHGCDRKLGEAVLAGKKTLVPSQNGYDWLGAGIYFWENAPERALEWAKNCVSNPKRSKGQIKEPFVLGAIIDLGLCLNLTDVGQMEILRTAYDSVKESFERDGIKLPKNTEQNFIMEIFAARRKNPACYGQIGSRTSIIVYNKP